METAPTLSEQEKLSPLQTYLANREQNPDLSTAEEIAASVEAGEVSPEEALAIYKEYAARLEKEATTDELTGLLNRRGYEQKMTAAIESLNRPENRRAIAPVAVISLRIDLNGLRQINELGHNAGDAALARIGEVINNNVRDSDIAARVGGDEFAVAYVLQSADLDADHGDTTEAIVQRFEQNLSEGILPIVAEVGGESKSVQVSATVGHAIATPGTHESWRALDEAADADAVAKKQELKAQEG